MNTTFEDGPLDAGDVAVLTQLADSYRRLDPVPAGMPERIKFAITVRSLEAEVAQLVQERPLVVRGTDTHRVESVTFSAGKVSLMVSTTPSGELVRIDGWVTVAGAQVEASFAERSFSATADENGRFVIDGAPHGSVIFVIRLDPNDPDETPVVTPRIEV
ncbi:hypothetical protein DFJ65_0277 [Calidifontibacter indicus]|uniref:Carboxypeptidase regulatory-like domain-containing protein n=2 Tax=Calidifontibacter indicus TaxID=419650 RepID=A0A3D9UIT4_9MICO|nr:hypothetical protein DFJ65_0277 [Calidifontibacter indicus]